MALLHDWRCRRFSNSCAAGGLIAEDSTAGTLAALTVDENKAP
jgi:hypothetical protein